jgi:hypothetical protein
MGEDFLGHKNVGTKAAFLTNVAWDRPKPHKDIVI